MSISFAGNSWKVSVGSRGNRYRRSFPNREQAAVWEAEAQLAVLKGQIPPMSAVREGQSARTLSQLADVVYEAVWARTRGEVTAMINSSSVVRILGPDTDISSIGPDDVDHLIRALSQAGNSPATINRKLAALSKMLGYAAERGWIPRRIKIQRMKESKGRVRWMSRDEYRSVVEDLVLNDPMMKDLVVFLTETGVRLGEALALRWEDIDSGYVRIWENKGDKPRSVPVSVRVQELLDALRVCGDELGPFASFTVHSVRHRWNMMKFRMAKENDTEFTPHCCRHTFASWLVQAGVPIYTVKELCGHKCIEVTMRYAHLADGNLSSAIARTFNA